ncbi:sensor histidine kinase [Deinococcus sp. ME38]|uniref:sensor histidine kinase n=1 Tax=Deinococcus sp. ME38 TaxID=3400344 RepID=UPI003B59A167
MTTLPPSAPSAAPVRDSLLWSLSLPLLLGVLLLDLLTPASLAVGTLLCASVAFAALGASRQLTLTLTGLCVGANVLAGALNADRDGLDATTLANRAVSILAVLLVGFLSLRAREARARAARIEEDARQLERERALRALAEAMGGPLGQAEFVDRAAHALRTLTGADHVEIGAVERAFLRAPHALAGSGPGRLNTRLPLDLLAHPAGAPDVWAVDGGRVQLARLRRTGTGTGPEEADLLIVIGGPQTPPNLTAEAVRALQPILDRTALLDDLRVQGAQLAERGEVLRDLVYAFSHDLRTPLLANAMNLRAALRGGFGPLPAEYLATLENGLQANETLLDLADQLLLLAKYEADEPDAEPQVVALREVLLGVLRDLGGRAAERRVTLEPQLEGARVLGQRHDLRRAAQNLLENAVKFSPPGGEVRVTLSAADGEVRLTVQDEGPGVPPARAARLFQRFRGGGAGGGTGLGLYLTRRVAQAHGGNVTYARTGAGRSVFTLTLPAAPEGPRA